MGVRQFHAFRGTDFAESDRLFNHREFTISTGKDEYLGHGVYFFEDNPVEAHNWAKYVRRLNEHKIILFEANIQVASEKVLDFLLTDHHMAYLKLVDSIDKRYRDARSKPRIRKPYDCGLINMICEKDDYELVRAAFSLRNKLGLELIKKARTRIEKIHIQLCVRNVELIKHISKYNVERKKLICKGGFGDNVFKYISFY